MTTTVQAPPPAAVPTTATTAGPPEGPRSRRWLLGFWGGLAAALLSFPQLTLDSRNQAGQAALHQKIGGARLEGGDRGILANRPGQHDERQLGM